MLLRTITALSAVLTAVLFFCSDVALWLLPLLFVGFWLVLLLAAFLVLLAFSPIGSAVPPFTAELKGDVGLSSAINSMAIVISIVINVILLGVLL